MHRFAFLFLLLVAAHPPGTQGFHHHHQRMAAWGMGSHDGSSPRDFGRMLAPNDHLSAAARDRIEVQEPRRLNSFAIGGSRLGIGFVGGRHLGFRLKSGF